MSWPRLCFTVLFVAMCMAQKSSHASNGKLATVNLIVVDAFGHEQTGCDVVKFVALDDDKGKDYKFEGLTGRNVPLSNEYLAGVQCNQPARRGSGVVPVSRQDQFALIVASTPGEDLSTGATAPLTLSVVNKRQPQREAQWAELVAFYWNFREIDRIDPESGLATFRSWSVAPGRYFVVIHNSEKPVCTRQIDLLAIPAALDISVSQEGCQATNTSHVRVID